MRSVITGVAGFIGSHLAEKLLALGHEVVGVDKFLDNYARRFKDSNLSQFANHPSFSFINDDLASIELSRLLTGADYVFHLAAQPGVRSSWGEEFSQYSHNNILATQLLLEACKRVRVTKVVYASSSSVYGDTDDLPMREDGGTRPVSPYGVSKLAAEHLCYLYWKAFGIPTVSLRFFTVYGPRQRPDMFFHIFMRRLFLGEEIPLYDDGEQSRDFTYCADIVDGLVAAACYPGSGDVFNLGGGSETTLLSAIQLVERISGRKAKLTRFDRQRGDVRHTRASLDQAKEKLGYRPLVSLEEGLSRQWEWTAGLGN
ncbi:MAG TPA: NAD-dependent epimerase/dehydratase family protein [Candidatus Binatia bacterium]|jgi:nucleoside-diphosphate-sugar epimerase|nr:NAD-dependent epimerase/dehydratase family protein [Candidatus Binatia bacterium]